MKNKSFEIAAEGEIPTSGADGMLITHGGRFSGFGFYLLDGKLVYHYNRVGVARYTIVSTDKLPAGQHRLTVDFKYDGTLGKGGDVVLSVDGQPVAVVRVERTLPFRLSLDETMDIDKDTGRP